MISQHTHGHTWTKTHFNTRTYTQSKLDLRSSHEEQIPTKVMPLYALQLFLTHTHTAAHMHAIKPRVSTSLAQERP